jgi:hypothetical protein
VTIGSVKEEITERIKTQEMSVSEGHSSGNGKCLRRGKYVCLKVEE